MKISPNWVLAKVSGADNLPTKEEYFLSPLEKWRTFGKFPFKMLTHFVIVFLIIAQVLLLSAEFSQYGRSNYETFNCLFQPNEFKDGIFTVDRFVSTLNQTIFKYFDFPGISVDIYSHVHQRGSSKPLPVIMTVNKYDSVVFNRTSGEYYINSTNIQKEVYELDIGEIGPFEVKEPELKVLLYSLIDVTLQIKLENFDKGGIGFIPFFWTITLSYDFANSGGQIFYHMKVEREMVQKENNFISFQYIEAFLLFCGFFLLYLELRSLLRQCYMYTRVSIGFSQIPREYLEYIFRDETHKKKIPFNFKSWKEVPISKKLKFFNLWTFSSLVQACLIILAEIMAFFKGYAMHASTPFCIMTGLAAFFSTTNLMMYLEHNKNFNTLIGTLRISTKTVLSFIISVLPIYLGFTLFGVAVFSEYDVWYADVDRTSVTLFALLNGDAIHEAFDRLFKTYPHKIVVEIYLYAFISFFITTVLNEFILIIEDAFHAAKKWGKRNEKFEKRKPVVGKVLEVLEKSKSYHDLFLQTGVSPMHTTSRRFKTNLSGNDNNINSLPSERSPLIKSFPLGATTPADIKEDIFELNRMRNLSSPGPAIIVETSEPKLDKMPMPLAYVITETQASFDREIIALQQSQKARMDKLIQAVNTMLDANEIKKRKKKQKKLLEQIKKDKEMKKPNPLFKESPEKKK